MPERELPRLSSAELTLMFGDDVAALQRYRMLAAVVREGRPAAEVARAFGVSRESLRRLRRAFSRGDLAALRSRRRGGGHFSRGSPLANALLDELAIAPSAPAAQLWRRVSARLAEQGQEPPRSTFYRLLGRLRADEPEGESGRAVTRMLREALADLLEDPPLALGRGALADLLAGDEPDQLQRGRTLAAALRVAIERLGPGDDAPPDDPRRRHYQILAGEYLEGRERAELEEALALSASTYSRAKREAIERLRALLPGAVDEQPAAPAPAPADPTPDLAALADAAAEVAALLPPALVESLGQAEREAALAALAPLEALAAALRAAQHAPDTM